MRGQEMIVIVDVNFLPRTPPPDLDCRLREVTLPAQSRSRILRFQMLIDTIVAVGGGVTVRENDPDKSPEVVVEVDDVGVRGVRGVRGQEHQRKGERHRHFTGKQTADDADRAFCWSGSSRVVGAQLERESTAIRAPSGLAKSNI